MPPTPQGSTVSWLQTRHVYTDLMFVMLIIAEDYWKKLLQEMES